MRRAASGLDHEVAQSGLSRSQNEKRSLGVWRRGALFDQSPDRLDEHRQRFPVRSLATVATIATERTRLIRLPGKEPVGSTALQLLPILFEQRRRALSLVVRARLLDTSYAISKVDKNLLDGSFDFDLSASKHHQPLNNNDRCMATPT